MSICLQCLLLRYLGAVPRGLLGGEIAGSICTDIKKRSFTRSSPLYAWGVASFILFSAAIYPRLLCKRAKGKGIKCVRSNFCSLSRRQERQRVPQAGSLSTGIYWGKEPLCIGKRGNFFWIGFNSFFRFKGFRTGRPQLRGCSCALFNRSS